MLTNEQLKEEIAWSYPKAYHEESWAELLSRYIDDQLEKHYQTIDHYKQHAIDWQQSDPAVTVPDTPLPPAMLVYACEVHAQQSGFTFQTLAFCLCAAEKKAFQFKDDYDLCRQQRDYFRQQYMEQNGANDAAQTDASELASE